MKNLFTYLFLGLLLFSCGKKRTIVITATNAATGHRIPGLAYNVFSSYTGGNGQKYKTVASGVLNSQGEATLDLRQIPNKSYCVKVEEPSNTCYNKVITMYFGSPNDEDGHFNFEFAECATLQRIVKNINCINSNDKIEISIDNTMHSLIKNPWILEGCANYSTVPTKYPIGTYYLHWIVTKNNVVTEYNDSFYLNVNENKIHTINY